MQKFVSALILVKFDKITNMSMEADSYADMQDRMKNQIAATVEMDVKLLIDEFDGMDGLLLELCNEGTFMNTLLYIASQITFNHIALVL